MKREIRVLGVDDGFFEKQAPGRVLVVGVVTRGADYVDGVASCFVQKDGFDATEKLAELVQRSKHRGQLRVIMVHGSTLAGFNIIDIRELCERTRLPVICVLREKPDAAAVRRAVQRLAHAEKRLALLEKLEKTGPVHAYKKLFFQCTGLREDEARQAIDVTLRRSNLPEPVRLAHLIASGVTLGESARRA